VLCASPVRLSTPMCIFMCERWSGTASIRRWGGGFDELLGHPNSACWFVLALMEMCVFLAALQGGQEDAGGAPW